MDDLHSVNGQAVLRRLAKPSGVCYDELHGFCDASSVTYGAAIYLRTEYEDGSTTTTLVTAKARVLPVRPVTIPRAELLGAHLLAKLLNHTSSVLQVPSCRVHAWTDSEIVLHWLPKSPPQLDRFVANRVYNVQCLLPDVIWKHVKTDDNPADLASRGVRAPDLAMSALWWSGPPWLSLPPDQWPQHKKSKPPVPVLIASIKPCLQLPREQSVFLGDLWARFSYLFKLVRVVAWIYRFFNNCKKSLDLRRFDPSI